MPKASSMSIDRCPANHLLQSGSSSEQPLLTCALCQEVSSEIAQSCRLCALDVCGQCAAHYPDLSFALYLLSTTGLAQQYSLDPTLVSQRGSPLYYAYQDFSVGGLEVDHVHLKRRVEEAEAALATAMNRVVDARLALARFETTRGW